MGGVGSQGSQWVGIMVSFWGGIHVHLVDLVAVSYGEVQALVCLYTLLFITTLFFFCLLVSHFLVLLMFLLMLLLKNTKYTKTQTLKKI